MKKTILSILLACILALGVTMPVLADEDKPKKLEIGDKVALETGHEATYLGKGVDGSGQIWQADIGYLKYIPGTDTLIECQWDYDIDKGEWFALPNLFTAIVKGTKVTVWNEGVKVSWQPEVFVGTKKLASSKSPYINIIDPINENYYGNTIHWNYSNGITRYLRIIEGMLIEYYTIEEVPGGDILIIPHTTKDAGFVWTRPSEAWDADFEPVELAIGKNGELTLLASDIAGATLPITIDPDTTFTTSASDGYLATNLHNSDVSSDASWNAAHDDVSAGSVYGASTKSEVIVYTRFSGGYLWQTSINRAYLFFDTSAIPDDANITSTVLQLYGVAAPTTDFGAWVLILQEGMPTYPHDPLVAGDLLHSHYSGAGGTLASGDMGSGYKDLTLSAEGRGWINAEGVTKLCLREDNHDENDTKPSYGAVEEWNRWQWYTYEQGAGYRPKLVVTWAATAPAITADAASYVAKTTARLNSTVDDDGQEDCDVRFGYGTTTQAVFTDYDTNTAWVEDEYTTGEHPYVDIDSLIADTEYFWRVQIRNSHSTVTSSELTFTTVAALSPPTNFKAFPSSTSIGTTWTLGDGATSTMVRYSETSYPTDETEGTLAYSGTLASYTITGLTIGHTYYIVAIGVTDGEYSATVEVMATTSAAEGAATGLGISEMPEGLYQAPETGEMSNMPGYEIFNQLSSDMNIPFGTIWFFIIMGATSCIAYAVFRLTNDFLTTLIVLVVGLAYGTVAQQLPLWMAIFALVLGIGLSQMQARRGQ